MSSDEPLQARDAPRSQEDVDLARSAAQSVRRLLVEQDGGRALVDGLLAALSGDLPAQFLEEGRGSLLGCLWKLRLFCPPEVCRWCGASLEVITANFASTEIAGDLLNAVSVDPPRRGAFHGGRRLRAVLPDEQAGGGGRSPVMGGAVFRHFVAG